MAQAKMDYQNAEPVDEQEMDPLTDVAMDSGDKKSSPPAGIVNLPAFGKLRILKTCGLFANYIFLLPAGIQTNAALVDLAHRYSVSLTTMSVFPTVYSMSLIVGSWIGGLLYSRINVFALLSCFAFIFVSALASCVFMPNVALFFVFAAVWATTAGAIDSVVNSHFLALWDGERVRDSLMQAMHAGWSAGAMGMGATLNLFLNPNLGNQTNQKSANFSLNATLSSPASSEDHVPFAYVLFACVGLIPLCSNLVLLAMDRRRLHGFTGGESETAPEVAETTDGSDGRLTGRAVIGVVTFAVLLRIFDVEGFISTFLSSYLFYGLGWSTPDASVAFSVFFAGQFVGRLLSVLVSAFVRPLYILLANASLILVSSTVLGVFGHAWFIPYVTSFIMGLGNSSTFPSVFLWLSTFTPITGPVSASLYLGNFDTLMSPISGHIIESKWPKFFVFFVFCACCISSSFLLVGNCIGLRLMARKRAALAKAEIEAVAEKSEGKLDKKDA